MPIKIWMTVHRVSRDTMVGSLVGLATSGMFTTVLAMDAEHGPNLP